MQEFKDKLISSGGNLTLKEVQTVIDQVKYGLVNPSEKMNELKTIEEKMNEATQNTDNSLEEITMERDPNGKYNAMDVAEIIKQVKGKIASSGQKINEELLNKATQMLKETITSPGVKVKEKEPEKNIPQGKGTITPQEFANREFGEIIAPSGKNKVTSKNGKIYEEDSVLNTSQEKGTATSVDKSTNDIRTGLGEMIPQKKRKLTPVDGNIYNGETGKKHVEHVNLTFANGSSYVGDFVNNEMHGKGKHISADGKMYEGDLVHNIPHGKGKFTYTDGNTYEGDFSQNLPHGKGKIVYNDGNTYEGDFVNGYKQGKGF